MEEKSAEISSFNGMAGRVLMGALSVEALITGLIVVGVLKGAQLGLAEVGQSGLFFLVAILFVSILLTRFAVNGRVGERRGFLFSEEGGSWGEVFTVGLRFLALWAFWLVPLELVGLTPTRMSQTLMTLSMGQVDAGTITLTLAVVLAMAACPVVFLVLSVGSPGFLDVFAPTRWGALFRGRLSELFSIYVIHLGAVGVIMLISAPLVLAGGMVHSLAGTILNWSAMVLAAGVGVDLLGRLCGVFVFTGGADWTTTRIPESESPRTRAVDFAPVVEAGATVSAVPGEMIVAELKDARERVQNILEDLATYPDRVVFALEDLHSRYAPNPLVLHSLCLLYDRAGRKDDSIGIAPRALSVCLEQKADWLAAEVLATRIDMIHGFDLDRDTVLRLAETLHRHEKLNQAETVYRALMEQSPGDRAAIKGLLKIGESLLSRNTDPKRARMIYVFLLEHAADSPLGKFMRDGLAEAERRLAA